MPYPSAPDAPGEWRESFFQSPDGLRLFSAARVIPSPKAVVVVVHGYADHLGRYRHVMDALAFGGYSSYALDYRGHGQSTGRRGFVAQFSEYLGDLSTFIAKVRAENPSLPLYILAHSHGCLVSGMLLTEPDGAKGIAGAIFSAPYYRLRIEPTWFQLFQAQVVGKLIPFLPVKAPLTVQMLTRDPEYQKVSDVDPLRFHIVTPRWFTESNAAQVTLLARAPGFKLPLLLMVGAEDPIANPEGGRSFFEAAGSADKKFISYPGMLHEIFNEIGREKPIGEVVAWLDARVQSKAATA